MKNDMSNARWMLYGATGYTGRLIVGEAVRRGSRPIIAGRNAEKVRSLATAMGLEWTAFAIDNQAALRRAVESVDLVLNAAGPFSQTSVPMMDVCLEKGVDYLDIANEIAVFRAARDRHHFAEERGIVVLPGVGFGAAASSCLARRVCENISDPVSLEICVLPYVAQRSAGAAKSMLEAIVQGGRVRRGGKLVTVSLGYGAKRMRLPDGERNVISVPSGDLEAAYMATGIPDITVYAHSPLPPILARNLLPFARLALSRDWMLKKIEKRIERSGQAEINTAPDGWQRSRLWARVTNRSGHAIEGGMETGEGYAFTAAASVLAVERVLDERPCGSITAASFGADFVLKAGAGWVGSIHHVGTNCVKSAESDPFYQR